MPFSVSTCLTNTGTLSLGPTLNIYSNPVTNLNPGTFVRTVPTTSITGANCPFSFLVPDGTQTVRIFDPVSFCYVDIAVSDNNVCVTCSLGLNNITNNLIGQINVGSLTGNCDNSINDYSIKWYGPDNPTNFAFSSGQGTLFSGQYQYTQPLTSSNSPVLNPGVYVARITNVDLNGLKFTSTGGTGNITSCTLTSCTTSVTVNTYSCLNGNPSTAYGHFRSFTYNGVLPPALSNTKLKLDAGRKYVVFGFIGFNVFDTIKFTLSGSAYPSPILLENITVGTGISDNFTPTTWPKSVNTDLLFRKIINLTGFTINENDIIDITITPNTSTNETNWQLYFGCSTKPTGSKTCLDTYKNTPYKIKQSTIPGALTQSASVCPPKYSLSFQVSGCNSNDNATWTNSTLYTYTYNNSTTNNINTSVSDNLLSLSFGSFYDSYSNIVADTITNLSQTCQSSVGADYRIEKINGFIKFYFRNINDLYTFGNSFNATKTQTTNFTSPPATGPYSTNNANINYYRHITFDYKTNNICGDGASSDSMIIPVNSTLSSGTTGYLGYSYIMTITLPIQTYNSAACPAGNCDCSSLSGQSKSLNTNTTGTTTPYTLNKLLTNPFGTSWYYYSSTQNSRLSDYEEGTLTHPYPYADKTYPATGSGPYTLVPSLSASTWDWENHFYVSGNNYQQYAFRYYVIAKTPLTNLGFEIWAYSISNFNLGTYRKIFDSATGVVSGQESFFV